MPLFLEFAVGDKLLIGDDIEIMVTRITPGLHGGTPRVKLSVKAPQELSIARYHVAKNKFRVRSDRPHSG